MKIMVDIGHPAHVHFFKNMIWKLEERGHEIKITVRDKDVTLNLLDAYGFNYENIGKSRRRLTSKLFALVKNDYKMLGIAKVFKPDILLSVGSPYSAQVSRFIKKPSIVFEDTEYSREQYWLYAPFASVICTPSCFKKDLGEKQIRYNGYHEMAYLHPNYFKPDPSVLDELNLSRDDKLIILRFVSWGASHDYGQKGLGLEMKGKLVKKLEKYGRVLITSEKPLSKELEKYRITITPEKLHDILCYAQLCLSDGGTTGSEAAILGTPSIHVATTAKYCGVFEDMHDKYDLIYTFDDGKQGFEKAVNLLENNSKKWWASKKEKLLKDKIDVTTFMTWFIDDYPESFQVMKENPQYQERFK